MVHNKEYSDMLAAHCLFCRALPLNSAGETGNENIFFQYGGRILKQKNNLHHGPKPIPNICQLPVCPFFSLVPPFNSFYRCIAIVGLFDLYVCMIESEQSFVLFKNFPSRNRKDDFEQRRQSEAALISLGFLNSSDKNYR
jgi:hypothetical protein